MKRSMVRALIGYLTRLIYKGDPDPTPLTIVPVVKVEPSEPVPLSALQAQSEKSKRAMEEKRKRALSYLAANALLHRDETPLADEPNASQGESTQPHAGRRHGTPLRTPTERTSALRPVAPVFENHSS